MKIQDMQKEVCNIVQEYNDKNGIAHNPQTSFHQLIEEVGELAREITKETNDWRGEGFSKEDLSKELIDVICNCLILADDYDIDIVDVFDNKMAEWRTRWKLDVE